VAARMGGRPGPVDGNPLCPFEHKLD